MKEAELRAHTECAACGQKVTKAGTGLLFWRLKIERHGLNVPALQRQQGLGMMIGAPLAAVMGPDEDMTTPVMPEVSVAICEDCATRPVTIAALIPEGDDNAS